MRETKDKTLNEKETRRKRKIEENLPTEKIGQGGENSKKPTSPQKAFTTETYIDLKKEQLDDSHKAKEDVVKHYAYVPVRRPGQNEWFRTRPGDDWYVDVATLRMPSEQEPYLVAARLVPYLSADIKRQRLFLYITRQLDLGLWPVTLPNEGRPNSWAEGALRIIQLGFNSWVRCIPNQSIQSYSVEYAKQAVGGPRWPDITMEQIVNIAFSARFIHDAEDPAFRYLKGIFHDVTG